MTGWANLGLTQRGKQSTFLGYFADETVGARYGTLCPLRYFFAGNNTIMQRGSA